MTIFIIHCKWLVERRRYLENKLPCSSIWIDDCNTELLSNYIYNPSVFNRRLKVSEISLATKHYECYKRIINDNIQSALILEDDVLFEDGVFDKLNILPSKFDICYLGDGCGLSPRPVLEKYMTAFGEKTYPLYESNKIFYDTDFGVKATDSYIITSDACKFLMGHEQFSFPIDYHINQFNNNPLKIYWTEPPLFKQGSQNGIYKSAIQ